MTTGEGTAASLDVLEVRTTSADETRSVARALAPLCRPGDVLLLSGDLGAGKTTFAQGFGAGLGITEPITSPTFTLVRQYPVGSTGPGRPDPPDGHPPVRTLLHADVYRLDNLQEIVDLGLGELVEDGGVALVEWGEAAEPVLGQGSLAVLLAAVGDDDEERLVSLRPDGPAWSERWPALQAVLAPWASGVEAGR